MPQFFSVLITLWCISASQVFSQDPSFNGPVSLALANMRTMDDSPWASFNNGSLATVPDHFNTALAYQNRFYLPELSSRALAVHAPSSYGTFSAVVLQSGYSKSLLSRYGLSYARDFGRGTSAFVQYNSVTHRLEGADRGRGFYSSMGLKQTITRHLQLGVLIVNPEQAVLTIASAGYDLPVLYALGVRWSNGSWARVFAEMEKEPDYTAVYKGALEMNISDAVVLRGGVRGQPVEMSLGSGFRWWNFSIDAAFSYHRQLGVSSALGLNYIIKPKVK